MTDLKVYIVDDKRLIRESLVQTIRWHTLGFSVVGSSGDGIIAEEDIRRLRPDIVVTDIRMPGLDGLSLTTRIRDFLPNTQVIIITGYDEFEYAQQSLRAGAVDIILKPIRNEDLEQALVKASARIKHNDESSMISGELPPSFPKDRPVGILTRAVILYIEENLSSDISLASMADMYRVTPSHLSRTFKKETGWTFLKYLIHRRIEKAQTLLADPSRRISEISETCGFRTPARFTQVFKRIKRQTPSEYRKGFEAIGINNRH
jgi:two-component system response regulator YesN